MNIFQIRKKQRTKPFLNLFWFILFLPVAVIVYLLWQEKLPWLEEEIVGEGNRQRRPRGMRQPERMRHEKAPDQHEKAQETRDSRTSERRMPDEKRQKAVSKEPHQAGASELGFDKLEVIEGIGTKTASILRAAGIRTFQRLADASMDELTEILDAAGIRLNPPDTWPEQARLAADGKWDELEELKGRLHAGRPAAE